MTEILKARQYDPYNAEANRIARLLLETWSKVEPEHPITKYPVSYMASFADMAKAVVEHYREDFLDEVKTAIAAMCSCHFANCTHDKIRHLVTEQSIKYHNECSQSLREELAHLRTKLGETEFALRSMTKACADAAAVTEKAIERLERAQPIINAACNLVREPNRINYQWELEEAVLEHEKGKPS